MEKIAFVYTNHLDEMICSQFFRIIDGEVSSFTLNYETDEDVSDNEGELEEWATDFKNFDEVADYYGNKQSIVVVEEASVKDAVNKIGAKLP